MKLFLIPFLLALVAICNAQDSSKIQRAIDAVYPKSWQGNMPPVGGVVSGMVDSNANLMVSTSNGVSILGPILNAYAAYNASGAAAVTLTAAQSGQTFLLDAATGVVYTLPAPVVGLTYTFQASVSVTSNSHEVRTNTSTVFIAGNIAQVGSTTTFGFNANGTSIQAYKANGTTSGGLIGTQLVFTCVSPTKWMVGGTNVASGTAGTPFTATP